MDIDSEIAWERAWQSGVLFEKRNKYQFRVCVRHCYVCNSSSIIGSFEIALNQSVCIAIEIIERTSISILKWRNVFWYSATYLWIRFSNLYVIQGIENDDFAFEG